MATMPGQWTKGTGRAAAALAALVLLSACVSDEQAVDMGLATRCDGTTRFAPLGHAGAAVAGEASARFLRGDRVEQCRGARRDAGNRTQLIVLDCATQTQLTASVAQAMANPARHGPDFDLRAVAEAQVLRLKTGLTDLAGLQAGLQSAGIRTALQGGVGAEQCIKAGAVASAQN